jgi:hypothetical protein
MPSGPENQYFDVSPRILRADAEAEITVRPRFDHCRFDEDATYEVTCFPAEQLGGRGGLGERGGRAGHSLRDGALGVRRRFEGEQEHVLLVERIDGDTRARVGAFRVYSVADDLFGRRPYKGDLHVHSCRSDGRESPGYVAGACRRIGLDFVAVTDHRRYAPSLEAAAAFDGVDIDLGIHPGEEVHPPDNPVHIVNFGGGLGLSELFADAEAHRAQVKEVEESLPELARGVDPYAYASCVWCFEKIREAGGLGIFCHPYWFCANRYDVPGALTSQLLEDRPFDALEVISGFHRNEVESNTLQVARYHDERAGRRRMPVVGVSDAHGCERGELFGWYYTIVLSPTPGLADLIASVKDLHSVAVEALPGETPRAHGPFRLVKYAQFLLREVLPRHDELCLEEGRLMLAHLAGDEGAARALSGLAGRAAKLYDRLWAE